MTEKTIRETITFSCDPEFKALVGRKQEELNYQTKSQMIRDALQNLFQKLEMLENIPNTKIITAIISVFYDHRSIETVQQFLHIQHSFHISYSFHHHLNHNECIETLIIRDEAENVKELVKEVHGISGTGSTTVQLVTEEKLI